MQPYYRIHYDVDLVTCLPEENQALLDRTEHFLKWTETMETRPKKCWSLALKRSASRDTNDGERLYRRFNPNLNLSGRPLCYLDEGDFRYLSRPTNAAGCKKTTRNEITATLERLLQQVDVMFYPPRDPHIRQVVWEIEYFFTLLGSRATELQGGKRGVLRTSTQREIQIRSSGVAIQRTINPRRANQVNTLHFPSFL